MAFPGLLTVLENRFAVGAAQRVCESIASSNSRPAFNPLFIHGRAGTGKSYLVHLLVSTATRRRPDLIVSQHTVAELLGSVSTEDEISNAAFKDEDADLIVIEDLQVFERRSEDYRRRFCEALAHYIDSCRVQGRQLVFTANKGPAHLNGSSRLVSRLASGLVAGIEPLHPGSRLYLLREKAQKRQLAVSHGVLEWLARQLSGGIRQLEGTVLQLEALSKMHQGPLDERVVAAHFGDYYSAPSVERIAERVRGYFRLRPGQLQSRRRHRNLLLARQVGMYLARSLTGLSLSKIGDYFGGRDHSTVLHACRKIEDSLSRDLQMSAAVKQLQAELV